MAWNCRVGFVGMFGTDAIANFDLSKWLLNSLFNIGNPFAIYFWLVAIVIILRFTFIIIPLVKLISLFSGKRGAKAFSAFFKLRKINSSAFKPLENYLLFESFRMLTPGLCAILLRLILGESLIYKWDFIQLWIILPSIVVWLLYNLIGIKESNDTINTAAKTLAPKINVPFTGNSKEKTFNTAPIISTLFSTIIGGLFIFIISLFSFEIVSFVFERGAFSTNDTLLTSSYIKDICWSFIFMFIASALFQPYFTLPQSYLNKESKYLAWPFMIIGFLLLIYFYLNSHGVWFNSLVMIYSLSFVSFLLSKVVVCSSFRIFL